MILNRFDMVWLHCWAALFFLPIPSFVLMKSIFLVYLLSSYHPTVALPSVLGVCQDSSIAQRDSVFAQPDRFTEDALLVSFDLKLITGGLFVMGCTEVQSDCEASENPPHQVMLADFKMMETEVTQALWEEVMGENPSYFRNCYDCPVENVSWYDIQLFIKKLNTLTMGKYRLPTEAEWEYAAREGGKEVMFGNGKNLLDPSEANFNAGTDARTAYSESGLSKLRTTPVKRYPPNALGLYDMVGNVWEWCSDVYSEHYYSDSPDINPLCEDEGDERVLRGGSWYNSPRYNRATYRNKSNPEFKSKNCGFRLVTN